MGNWRTVNITGTMTAADAKALREHLGYSYRVRDDPAIKRFGPLSFSRDQPSLCGLNDWPAPVVNRAGNLAERDYDADDVAEELRKLVTVAGSMLLVVHCGADWESEKCIATIRVGEGLVSIGKPEVEKIAAMSDEQATLNVLRALSGGY